MSPLWRCLCCCSCYRFCCSCSWFYPSSFNLIFELSYRGERQAGSLPRFELSRITAEAAGWNRLVIATGNCCSLGTSFVSFLRLLSRVIVRVKSLTTESEALPAGSEGLLLSLHSCVWRLHSSLCFLREQLNKAQRPTMRPLAFLGMSSYRCERCKEEIWVRQ